LRTIKCLQDSTGSRRADPIFADSQSLVQTLADERRPIPGQDLGLIGFFVACEQLDLLGTPLFGSRPKLRRDSVRINHFFSKAGPEP
jgi:hypothetical protein